MVHAKQRKPNIQRGKSSAQQDKGEGCLGGKEQTNAGAAGPLSHSMCRSESKISPLTTYLGGGIRSLCPGRDLMGKRCSECARHRADRSPEKKKRKVPGAKSNYRTEVLRDQNVRNDGRCIAH